MNYLFDTTTNGKMRGDVATAALAVADAQVALALASKEDKRAAKALVVTTQAALATLTTAAADLYANEMVERISAQDGKTKMQCRRADIGTCCDPQRELYWTM